ncbi:MAG: hypothetical protein FWB90_06765 [Fibromonadales bacterium]|nr:hypothetical protein [Fibromonadales bacterium]
MNFYNESLAKSLLEKIAFFKNAGLSEEANLLQTRLDSLAENPTENKTAVVQKVQRENPIIGITRNNLRTKLAAENRSIPELEKQYILESASKAKTLKELETLQVSYIERLLKINRASRLAPPPQNASSEIGTGPYNNEKALGEALRLIYAQDPLWIEDFKELYFTIIPSSSITAASKSSL